MSKHKGKYYIDLAEKADNITVKKPTSGSHYKFYAVDPETNQNSMMVCPYGDMGTGTEHTIVRWLKRMGVIVTLALLCFGVFSLIMVLGF